MLVDAAIWPSSDSDRKLDLPATTASSSKLKKKIFFKSQIHSLELGVKKTHLVKGKGKVGDNTAKAFLLDKQVLR